MVDPATAQVVLIVPKRSKYHQAGMLAFGPDRYLYVSVGDDEASERAQDLGVLTGKILRLDGASAQPYAIPPSNPFVGTDARGEVWDYGLRNAWRFSFDRTTGDMWIGDVHHIDWDQGQNWETVEFQPAGSPGGVDFGFPMQATFHCVDVLNCRPEGVSLPVTHYDHNMNCSVTGGYVYRGSAIPALLGTYVFGDYCTGGVFAVRGSADQGWSPRVELGFQAIKISSFGEDPAGEHVRRRHSGRHDLQHHRRLVALALIVHARGLAKIILAKTTNARAGEPLVSMKEWCVGGSLLLVRALTGARTLRAHERHQLHTTTSAAPMVTSKSSPITAATTAFLRKSRRRVEPVDRQTRLIRPRCL